MESVGDALLIRIRRGSQRAVVPVCVQQIGAVCKINQTDRNQQPVPLRFRCADEAERILQHMDENTRKQALSRIQQRTRAEAEAACKAHLRQCIRNRSSVGNIHQMPDAEAQCRKPESAPRVRFRDRTEQDAPQDLCPNHTCEKTVTSY